jgi:hypothetical protein
VGRSAASSCRSPSSGAGETMPFSRMKYQVSG